MARRFALVVDKNACIACHACAVACKMENNLPEGTWWNTIRAEGDANVDTPVGEYPAKGEEATLRMSHYAVACQHCESPACAEVCPTGATSRDEETGLVLVDSEQCIGCKSCMSACPYDVRVYNDGEPKFSLEVAAGDPDAPAHVAGTVEKCTFCYHRLKKGYLPACIEACTGRVRYFGDLNDPESEVSKLLATREYEQLFPEQGTGPAVYYLK